MEGIYLKGGLTQRGWGYTSSLNYVNKVLSLYIKCEILPNFFQWIYNLQWKATNLHMEGFVKTRVFGSSPQSCCTIIETELFTHNNTCKCKQTESWDTIHHDHAHFWVWFCAVVDKSSYSFHISCINTKCNESINYKLFES